MDMRKLLEAVTKFAGEPKQRAGDQVRGTDKAKKGSKEHPFKGQLVGDSKDNMLRGLSQVAEDKSLEWELAEAYGKFMEDDLGVEPKRPTRKGSRHARGHEPKSGYTTVKAEELNEATKDEMWQGWTIRYESSNKKNQPVRWMAFHAKRGPQDAHKGQSDSVESALADAKAWIQSGGNAKEITTSSVTIDFNVKFANEIVNGNDFYAKIVAGPTLLISTDAKPGFKRSHIRTQKSKATDQTTLLPMISLSGSDAAAAGLKAHGRYLLGDTQKNQDGDMSFPLIYQSTVQAKGDMMRLSKPALTVAMNREVSGLEEGFAQDSADAQRSLSAAATDRVLQKYQDDPELSAIAKFMSRNNWTAQSIDDTMQGRGKFDIDWWKNTMSKNLPETKHKRKDAAVYEGIESADPVEGAVLAAVQELIQQGHTEVAPEVITNMVVAATSQPFLLKDLVDVNNKSAAVQHYVNSIDPAKVKFSNEILTVKNEDPLKDKKAAQAGVSNMAARAAGRNRLGESSHVSLKDSELARLQSELIQQAKKLGIDESRAHKIIANKLKQIELQRKISGDRESDDERNIRMAKQQKDYIKNTPDTIFKREIDEYGANQPTGTAGQTAMAQSSTTGTNQAAAVQQAATAIKSATQSTPASQTTSTNPADIKALEPLMKAMVQDPKLAGELKTISQKMQ